jgi:hypothetical protein
MCMYVHRNVCVCMYIGIGMDMDMGRGRGRGSRGWESRGREGGKTRKFKLAGGCR